MTATILNLKSKNQIYKDFKSFIETSLNEFGVTGWDVKKLHQIIKTEDLRPCIYMQILRKNQRGSQQRKNALIKNIYYKQYSVQNEVQIRFSATRREKVADTVNTFNGLDVLVLIRQYFQSLNGITMLQKAGYAQYRASDVQDQSFTNDDENIQLMPYFDCEFLYTDTWKTSVNKLDTVKEIYKKGV